MTIPLTFKKPELVARLEALLPAARKIDKQATAEHKKVEQDYLRRFREQCRVALKWSYEELKKQGFEVTVLSESRSKYSGKYYEADRPSCPLSRVSDLERVIAQVRAIPDSQKLITVTHRGKYHDVWLELTRDMPEAKGLC